jgi:hypothetical protein
MASKKWTTTAHPIRMHGLSTQEEVWFRRPVWDDIPCGHCGAHKSGSAMYEYGIAHPGNLSDIRWDGKVYCNLRCLPDDTAGIRRRRWSLRTKDPNAERKAASNKATAAKRSNHMAKLYEKYKSINKVAEIEGITKQRVSQLLKKAGVEMQ